MNKRYLPFALFPSVYAIPLSFYREQGIHYVLCDLDNTLDDYRTKEPSSRAKDLVAGLTQAGIGFAIVSNNTSSHVRRYGASLGVKAYGRLLKPFGFRLRRLLSKEGIDPAVTVLVGDQLLTDIPCGNAAGLRTILTRPLSPVDQPLTWLNRCLEKRWRKRIEARFASRKEDP